MEKAACFHGDILTLPGFCGDFLLVYHGNIMFFLINGHDPGTEINWRYLPYIRPM